MSTSTRDFLHTLHLWIGVILCVPLFLLGLTGSILVFEDELSDLVDPRPVPTISTDAPRSIDEIVAAARAAAPRGQAPFFYMAPAEGEAAEIRLRGQGGPGARMYIDPSTANVLAVREAGGVLRTISQLHGNALIRDRSGRATIGWLGVAMLILGISGLVMWWPYAGRWRAVFRFNNRLTGPAFLREMHRTAGFWGLIVFMIVSFSGVYLAFPQTIGDTIRLVSPAREMRGFSGPAAQPIAGTQPSSLQEIVALVQARAPGLELRSVALPVRPDQTIRVSLAQPSAERGPVPQLTAFVDPWRREIVDVRDPQTYTWAESFMAWQRALHAGEGFGWSWRLLVFISGILPMLFTVTGFAMWWMRRRGKQRSLRLSGRVSAAGD